jgi:hypothetical protein
MSRIFDSRNLKIDKAKVEKVYMGINQLFCDLVRQKKIRNEFDVHVFATEYLSQLWIHNQCRSDKTTFQRGLMELLKDLKRSFRVLTYGQRSSLLNS